MTCKWSSEFIKRSSHFSSLCDKELIICTTTKSLAVSVGFTVPICLILLTKEVSMYVESSNEVFIRNTIYFGYEHLFSVQISFNPLQILPIKFGWPFWLVFSYSFIEVVDLRKLDLRQEQIILLSRIAILILKGYFGREKINFHEKNLKYRKIILLIDFIFASTFLLIAFNQILKNYAILINYKSLFQEKDSLQLYHFQLSKMNE